MKVNIIHKFLGLSLFCLSLVSCGDGNGFQSSDDISSTPIYNLTEVKNGRRNYRIFNSLITDQQIYRERGIFINKLRSDNKDRNLLQGELVNYTDNSSDALYDISFSTELSFVTEEGIKNFVKFDYSITGDKADSTFIEETDEDGVVTIVDEDGLFLSAVDILVKGTSGTIIDEGLETEVVDQEDFEDEITALLEETELLN